MAHDHTVRSLSALGGASSSRVLNLAAIAVEQKDNSRHSAAPFFHSPAINSAIILKHRLRADELDTFTPRRAIATKVIIPFQKTDLRAGGRSFFVGQRGFEDMLREAGNYGDRPEIKRDLEVLRLIDTAPSLDPFLLREHLRDNGATPDSSYFAISPADQRNMFEHVYREIRRLTSMAAGGKGGSKDSHTGRIVQALLSSEADERLDPLRLTLRLADGEFTEGMFAWRGLLYYKWSVEEFWPNIIQVLHDIKAIRPMGRVVGDEATYLANIKRALVMGVKANSEDVRRILKMYDDAYAHLIDKQDPRMFRQFLLQASSMFPELGQKIGSMSHVTSFWRYRFPDGAPKLAEAAELMTIFQDFAQSFGFESLDEGQSSTAAA